MRNHLFTILLLLSPLPSLACDMTWHAAIVAIPLGVHSVRNLENAPTYTGQGKITCSTNEAGKNVILLPDPSWYNFTAGNVWTYEDAATNTTITLTFDGGNNSSPDGVRYTLGENGTKIFYMTYNWRGTTPGGARPGVISVPLTISQWQ